MKNKKIIVLVLIVILTIFSKRIRYLLNGENDVIVSPPDAFYFKIMSEEGTVYYPKESGEKTYVVIDEKYFNNDDAQVYITGNYWNSPEKPFIKVNGEKISEVSVNNSGKSQSAFSDVYYSKKYHFYYYNNIEKNKEYTIYVRVKNTSKSIKVIFTS